MTENSQEIEACDNTQADENFKKAKHNAKVGLSSDVNAAHIIDVYAESYWGEQDKVALTIALGESIEKVQAGDLKKCEAMLMGQAMALQSIFVKLSRMSNRQDNLRAIDSLLRLALKAQSQCRTTLETLANMKNPPIIYAKQANIASGHQQVNNGFASVPRQSATIEAEKTFSHNELLSEATNETLDSSRAPKASRADTTMETVAAINRS